MINLMSFYILTKHDDFYIHSTERIIFAQVYRLDKETQIVIAIGHRGQFICCDTKDKQHIRSILTMESNSNLQILQVERIQNTLYILSQSQICCINIQNIFQRCKNGKGLELIPMRKGNQKEESLHINKLSNKEIKVIHFNNQWLMKLSGRLKNQISYKLFSVQNSQIGNAMLMLQYEFLHPFDYQFKASLQSLSQDIIIHQISITKAKPITVFSLEITTHSYGNSQKIVNEELIEHQIVQFKERMTIVNIQKINYSTICVIGSSHLQTDYSSVLILYNLKQKYTMNTIDMKDTLIINTYLFGNQHLKDYSYGDDTVFIDVIGKKADNTDNVTQIHPYCHFEIEITTLPGKVVNSQNNFLLYKANNNQSELGIYSKINKKALYCMLLKQLLPTFNPKFYKQIIDFL